jgi:hypothetical protein
VEITESVADEFLTGVKESSWSFLVGSLAMLALALLWRLLFARPRRPAH